MKTFVLSLTAGLCLTLAATAADPKPAPEPPPASPHEVHPDDLSKFKTADSLWSHIEELRKEPDVQPTSREQLIEIAKEWYGNQHAAAAAFIKAYPADERTIAAKLVMLQAQLRLVEMPGAAPLSDASKAEFMKQAGTILTAKNATEDAKGEAAYLQIMIDAEGIDETQSAMIAAFFKASAKFLAKYGDHRLAPTVRQTRFQLASEVDLPESEAVLKNFAEDHDPQIAEVAKLTLARFAKMKDLRKNPLDLKFTDSNGHEVDFANLRGKVVLLDFWASWCGPCMAEAPNVVATYQKLHEKGFEIVGVSLDHEKGDMEAAMKENGMTWAQSFDTGDNKIAGEFGIFQIPTTWLFDKKGKLRESGLRGEALAEKVTKLLAE